eukprot:SAG22_NODE_84_length_21617_cov_48.600102_15_plen_97_part_00
MRALALATQPKVVQVQQAYGWSPCDHPLLPVHASTSSVRPFQLTGDVSPVCITNAPSFAIGSPPAAPVSATSAAKGGISSEMQLRTVALPSESSPS